MLVGGLWVCVLITRKYIFIVNIRGAPIDEPVWPVWTSLKINIFSDPHLLRGPSQVSSIKPRPPSVYVQFAAGRATAAYFGFV